MGLGAYIKRNLLLIFAEGLLITSSSSCSQVSTASRPSTRELSNLVPPSSSTTFCSKEHKCDQFSKHPHTKPKLPNRPEPVCQKFSAKEREVRTHTQRSLKLESFVVPRVLQRQKPAVRLLLLVRRCHCSACPVLLLLPYPSAELCAPVLSEPEALAACTSRPASWKSGTLTNELHSKTSKIETKLGALIRRT